MIRALLYLQCLSTWNRLVAQAQRLRRPKYLACFVAGVLYFFFYFIRPLMGHRTLHRPGTPVWPVEFTDGLETFGAAILFLIVLAAWLFPQGRAALTFTEAEVAFLFPAPVRRQTLIYFKLLRSQAGILFTTLLMAFVSNRFGSGGKGWAHLAGWWIILSTLNLHFLGASFLRTRLLDWGIGHWGRRCLIGGVLILLSALSWWSLQHYAKPPTPEDVQGVRTMVRYLRELLSTSPLSYVLLPFRWTIRPYLASDVGSFFAAMGPAVASLALHFIWVIRSDVAFEEASVDLARRRAERMSALRRGPGRVESTKARRAPFELGRTGPVAIAFLWKNLIAAGSMFSSRMAIILMISFGVPAIAISSNARRGEISQIVSMLLCIAMFWVTLLGPQLMRQDFRQDLRSADLLKLYPLPGWKIVVGELLAPGVVLSAIQWALLVLLAILMHRLPGGREVLWSERLSVAAGAAVLFPAINFVSLLIPNAGVLLFPAWLQVGPQGPQGIEATGQRLIFLLGQLIFFALALLPATAVGLGLYFLLSQYLDWRWVVPVVGFAGAIPLLLEVVGGVVLLGKVFERLDIAAELRS